MIMLKGIRKVYSETKREPRVVLKHVNLVVGDEVSIAICGRSGSGKTTLLRILSGMDQDFEGEYWFDKEVCSRYSASEFANFRRDNIGIITQQFDLLEDRNVYENIVLSINNQKLSKSEKKERVSKSLEYVGLKGYEKRFIKQLSGGEMQRVGIARAIVKKPKLIIADEPTGSLDETTRNEILMLFKKMMQDGHQFIVVTHDETVAQICDQVYDLAKGELSEKELDK